MVIFNEQRHNSFGAAMKIYLINIFFISNAILFIHLAWKYSINENALKKGGKSSSFLNKNLFSFTKLNP